MSDREFLAAVGRRIRVARENAGMTPQALAVAASVSLATAYRWEKGTCGPGVPQLVRIARLVGVAASSLLGEGEP